MSKEFITVYSLLTRVCNKSPGAVYYTDYKSGILMSIIFNKLGIGIHTMV